MEFLARTPRGVRAFFMEINRVSHKNCDDCGFVCCPNKIMIEISFDRPLALRVKKICVCESCAQKLIDLLSYVKDISY